MSVLVTGAAGFLGRHVARALRNAGHDVKCHAGPSGTPGPADWYRGEIDDVDAVRRWVRDVEVVVHLAGPPWVGRSFSQPTHYMRVHALGTAAVLEAAADAGAHVVYFSSAEVYGRPGAENIHETCRLTPVSPYGAAKLAAESLAAALCERVNVTTLRPFCVYGADGHRESVTGRILDQVRDATQVLRLNDGAPIRDFVHVKDIARAAVLAVQTRPVGVFNLGTGRGTSIATLAQIAADAAGLELGVQTSTSAPDRSRVVAETNNAAKWLGWRAQISIEAGIGGCLGSNQAKTIEMSR